MTAQQETTPSIPRRGRRPSTANLKPVPSPAPAVTPSPARRTRKAPAKVSEPEMSSPPPLTPAQKAAATRARKAEEIKKASEALARELEKSAPAKAKAKAAKTPAEPRVTGYRAWATKPVTPAMEKFSTWIRREFPEVADKVDDRVVMIASKAYGYFQSSDLNPKE